MHLRSFALAAAAAAAVVVLVLVGPQSTRTLARADQADVQRGQYLTGSAGQCEDCHGKGLAGAPLRFGPKGPLPPGLTFIDTAPNLVGLPMFATDDAAVTFFKSGLDAKGQPARLPMPQYRFDDADARAIVAYLRSLKM